MGGDQAEGVSPSERCLATRLLRGGRSRGRCGCISRICHKHLALQFCPSPPSHRRPRRLPPNEWDRRRRQERGGAGAELECEVLVANPANAPKPGFRSASSHEGSFQRNKIAGGSRSEMSALCRCDEACSAALEAPHGATGGLLELTPMKCHQNRVVCVGD